MTIERLRERLIYHCYQYYVKADPRITDYEYDMLFKELERREKIEGTVFNSPTQMIYGDRKDQYPEHIRSL